MGYGKHSLGNRNRDWIDNYYSWIGSIVSITTKSTFSRRQYDDIRYNPYNYFIYSRYYSSDHSIYMRKTLERGWLWILFLDLLVVGLIVDDWHRLRHSSSRHKIHSVAPSLETPHRCPYESLPVEVRRITSNSGSKRWTASWLRSSGRWECPIP